MTFFSNMSTVQYIFSQQKSPKNDSQNQANEFETEDIKDTVIADENDNIGRCSDKSNPRFRGCTKYER